MRRVEGVRCEGAEPVQDGRPRPESVSVWVRARGARSLRDVFHNGWHSLLDAIMPQTCAACEAWIASGTGWLCTACASDLNSILASSYCPRCGRSLPPPAIRAEGCARCRHEGFWNVGGVARVGAYDPPIRRLTVGLKYEGHQRNAEIMADLLAGAIRMHPWSREIDYLVPVPMHWRRQLQRPCNHAVVLARALARRLRLPVLRAAARIKYTPSQVGVLSRRQRFENVRGCFAARPRPARRLAGKCICVVDNLLATGATIHEISKVLRRAGARRIYAAVFARTVLPGDAQAVEAVLPAASEPGSTPPREPGVPNPA